MKTIRLILLATILSGLLIPECVEAQGWGGRGKGGGGFLDNWSFNGNAGLTSFFGDLSVYDSEIMEKLTKESGPAFSGILTKHFNDKIGVSGQLLYGGLMGENTAGTRFEAKFIEYNIQARLELINAIFPNNMSNFGIDGYAGLGQFMFQSTMWQQVDGIQQEQIQNTGTPEFVYFAGMGIYYKLTSKFAVTADMALRQAQNDKLDDFKKNDNMDYYTHVSFGITYYIDSFKKSSGFSRGGSTKGRLPGRLPMRRRR